MNSVRNFLTFEVERDLALLDDVACHEENHD
jgi:hypothetical protein